MKLCSFWKGRKLSGKAGSFLERQEAFWKSRKLSGKSRKLLVYHEASDGPFGPFGTLGPKKCSKIGTFFDQLFLKKSTYHKVLGPSHYAKKMRIWILSISTFHKTIDFSPTSYLKIKIWPHKKTEFILCRKTHFANRGF